MVWLFADASNLIYICIDWSEVTGQDNQRTVLAQGSKRIADTLSGSLDEGKVNATAMKSASPDN